MLHAFDVWAEVVTLDSMQDVFSAVQGAKADAAVANHYFGGIRAHAFGLVESPIVFQPARLFYATAQGRNPALLTAIDQRLANWTQDAPSPYFSVLKRRGGDLRQETVPSKVWDVLKLLTGLLVFAVAAALFLRRQVRRQTAQLVAQNAQLFESLQQRKEELKAKVESLEQAEASVRKLTLAVEQSPSSIVTPIWTPTSCMPTPPSPGSPAMHWATCWGRTRASCIPAKHQMRPMMICGRI